MRYAKKLIFLTLVLFSFLCNGQDYNARLFTVKDGLSNDIVHSVAQDEKGFIWLGTDAGLNRFDGHQFRLFTKRKNNLADNVVSLVLKDQNDKLWLNFKHLAYVDLSQLSIFDITKERAIPFNKYFPNAPFQATEIKTINGNQKSEVWIVLKDGRLYRYDNKFELILTDEGLFGAREIKFFDAFEPVISVKNNIIFIDQDKQRISRTISIEKEVLHFNKLNDKRIWLLTRRSIADGFIEVFDLENDEIVSSEKSAEAKKYTPRFKSFQVFNEDNGRSQYWHTDYNKLHVRDDQGQLLFDLSKEVKFDLPRLAIEDIFLDRFKNIWIATTRGIVLLSPKPKLFQAYLQEKRPQRSGSSMRGLAELDDQNLVTSSYRGFIKVDKVTGDTSLMGVNYEYPHLVFGLDMLSLGDSILCAGGGNMNYWMIDKKTEKFKLYRIDFPKNNGFRFFIRDKYNQIWGATGTGVYRVDLKEVKIYPIPEKDQESELYKIPVNFILENGNELLLATEKGVFSINHQGEIIADFEELHHFQVTYIYRASEDDFWLGTKGNGLISWNKRQRSIHQFTKEQGLSDDFIYSITADEFGYYWLPSNHGLMRFDPKDFSVNIFNENDGIAHHEFNSFSLLKTDDGRFYLGGLNGITTFYPKDFQALEKKNTPLVIAPLKKMKDDEVLFKAEDGEVPEEIFFNQNDKAISLEFCLLDYQNSFQSRYAYKIEGYENEWKYLTDNKLIISRLPFGHYTLKVKAQGSYGTWADQEISLPLHVVRPFYLTWTFGGLSFMLFAALIYGGFRWRIILLEKKNLALEKIVKERTKELADLNKTKDQFFAIIAHDMRGLVLSFKNISQKVGFLQRKGRQDEVNHLLQSVDKSAESLSTLLDNLLNWALIEKGVFPHHPELFNVEKVVVENIKLFTQLSRVKEIELSYEVPETLNLYADKNAVSTVIRNLISNALKFSTAGDQVILMASQISGFVQIQIKDTGIGIEQVKLKNIFELDSNKTKQGTIGEKGTGLGLMLCKELVTLNQGKIQIESKKGKGTNVSIMFPLVA